MTTIQSQWTDHVVTGGYSLRLSFSCGASKGMFNDCVNYLHDIEKPAHSAIAANVTTHCFYMGNKHIYVFYEQTGKSMDGVKEQLVNHLRCGNLGWAFLFRAFLPDRRNLRNF